MKKIHILIITAILAFVGCTNDKNNDKKTIEVHTEEVGEHNENEIHLSPSQLKTTELKMAKIEKRTIRHRIDVTGIIEVPPQSKASIYAPLEAFVYKTDLLPGDKVRKGQTVAVLRHPNFTDLQYKYLEAVNRLKVAKSEYNRKKMLFESDIASEKSFQIAESSYRSAQNLVESYASQLQMAGLSPSTIVKNGIQQNIYIKSPISGYVTRNNLNKGKFLSANDEMMEIIDNDHLHAELNVFGTDVSKLKKGDKFIFTPNGIDKEYNGYIQLISQKIDDNTKTVNVHGHFEDEAYLLKVGTFINAEILLDGREVIAVPEEAVVEMNNENFIFKAESEDEFIPLEVTTGDADNGFVELKTIQGDDFAIDVVTQGTHFLKGEFLKKAGGMEGHSH